MQNVVGRTLVATATTFGLGAEIKSPTGLSTVLVKLSTDLHVSRQSTDIHSALLTAANHHWTGCMCHCCRPPCCWWTCLACCWSRWQHRGWSNRQATTDWSCMTQASSTACSRQLTCTEAKRWRPLIYRQTTALPSNSVSQKKSPPPDFFWLFSKTVGNF